MNSPERTQVLRCTTTYSGQHRPSGAQAARRVSRVKGTVYEVYTVYQVYSVYSVYSHREGGLRMTLLEKSQVSTGVLDTPDTLVSGAERPRASIHFYRPGPRCLLERRSPGLGREVLARPGLATRPGGPGSAVAWRPCVRFRVKGARSGDVWQTSGSGRTSCLSCSGAARGYLTVIWVADGRARRPPTRWEGSYVTADASRVARPGSGSRARLPGASAKGPRPRARRRILGET
jgi:hypothetical protein